MSDLMIKPVTPLPVASTGLSALALAQARQPGNAPSGDQVDTAGTAGKGAKQQENTNLLEKAATNIERYIPQPPPGTQLRIEKDQATNLYVYQAVNSRNGEVVSQYPSEQIIKFISFFREMEGMAVDKSA